MNLQLKAEAMLKQTTANAENAKLYNLHGQMVTKQQLQQYYI